MTDEEIKQRINAAVGILLKNDSFLLENGVNERAVAHKLGEYLQSLFPEWHVDCEYNRKGIEVKELDGINECSEQRTTDRVYPDIIVHKRNSEENLLVVEIKTIRDEEMCDVQKLCLFTSQRAKYKYQLGLFIRFNQLTKPELNYFKNGQLI